MDLTIHRGTHEIGGSCIELASASGKTRLVLDIGMPLVKANGEPFEWKEHHSTPPQRLLEEGILPRVEGLYHWQEPSVSAVILSHGHQDHYGFLRFVHPSIAVYLSKGTRALIEVCNVFLGTGVSLDAARLMDTAHDTRTGEFVVRAYTVDHSAPDAVALLIECDGSRLFYTGDFRGHGRKRALLDAFVLHPPPRVDCLVMEGTMLGRPKGTFADESTIETELLERFRTQKAASVVICSGQNLDRIVSVYRAAKRAGKTMVIDLYQAFVLDKLAVISEHIPQYFWRDIRVVYPYGHAKRLAEHDKPLLYKYKSNRIHPDTLATFPDWYVILARDNSYFRRSLLKRLCQGTPPTVIYSLWHGYLERGDLPAFLRQKGIELVEVHTSGHAYQEDLKRVAEALNPRQLVPIHTFGAERYKELFDNVVMLNDGETLHIGAN